MSTTTSKRTLPAKAPSFAGAFKVKLQLQGLKQTPADSPDIIPYILHMLTALTVITLIPCRQQGRLHSCLHRTTDSAEAAVHVT